MSVGENVCLDGHRLAHDALCRKPAAVDLRFHAFDDDARRWRF